MTGESALHVLVVLKRKIEGELPRSITRYDSFPALNVMGTCVVTKQASSFLSLLVFGFLSLPFERENQWIRSKELPR